RAEAAEKKTRRQEAAAKAKELQPQAKSILEADDPLRLVAAELRRQRYGGDLRSPLLTYVALTSRLLKLDKNSMPVHTLLTGPPAAGKSYIYKMTRALLPPEAWYEVGAGSPRVFLYDPEARDIRHKAIIFAEADSLPS